ncbi:response regulator [Minwuia sp.]|uniref:response regulator n=1 Tax=Minwuia sp. TaxID=2493630 RepID=UPI003A94D690
MEVSLDQLTILIADENDGSRRILNELLHAIGARDLHATSTFDLTQQFIKSEPVDLFICDSHLGGDRGAALIKEIRSIEGHPNGKIPMLLTCSHTRLRDLREARDCGVNMLLAKPYSVSSLYDRLAWIAHRPRPFVWAEGYKGPDRRFKDDEVEEDRRGDGAASADGEKTTQAAS